MQVGVASEASKNEERTIFVLMVVHFKFPYWTPHYWAIRAN
jgi:hypothetical protein